MKRTLERELKVLEIVEGEAHGRQECPAGLGGPGSWLTRHRAGLVSRGWAGGTRVGVVPPWHAAGATEARTARRTATPSGDLRGEAAGAMLPCGPS